MNNSNRKKTNDEGGIGSDEVEQLLQSAQDEMLLKLSVNSHIAHISSNYIDSDLDRRFQALKSRPSLHQSSSSSSSSWSSSSQSNHRVNDVNVNVDDELKSVVGDDLSVRFAALKASPSSSNDNKNLNALSVGPNVSYDDDNDEEDEVEKLIRWAKDAARLDPSPPSDDDKDSDCTDSDDDEPPRRKKDHRK
ncbi:hypothetical protein Pint_23254 [Pistacia integerrima]|uniref:Uncharacterized protein n=1 Tax=Pistacia integerrima TaxID=434235 RepID=A0ACC0YJQ8_9ROSI|nr:hypothetical protein Pint_23254 [Pistacia integerrima]